MSTAKSGVDLGFDARQIDSMVSTQSLYCRLELPSRHGIQASPCKGVGARIEGVQGEPRGKVP